MKISKHPVRTQIILVFSIVGIVAAQQLQRAAPNAPTQKAANITEIDVSNGLTSTGASSGLGVTGPTVGLGVATGGITNSMLAGSIDAGKISGTAATLGSNTFTGNQTINGGLMAGTLTANGLTVTGGNLDLPNSAGPLIGVITVGGKPFLHNYGGNNASCDALNTFLGSDAGNFTSSNQCAGGNTGVGASALQNISTGIGNTAAGVSALRNTQSGQDNVALGYLTLPNNTSGDNNTAIGTQALLFNQDGFQNIAIGNSAGSAAGAVSNHDDIYIGAGVGGIENNTIRVGGPNQTRIFVAAINGVTAGGTAVPVVVDGNGQLGTASSSSRRFKFEIADMSAASDKLQQLRPVTFRYKQAQDDGSHPLQYGLIAEEVAQVYPELVQYDPKTGQPNAVLYHVLPAMLLNEVQKDRLKIEAQQKQIQGLEQQLSELLSQARQVQAEMESFKTQTAAAVVRARRERP